MIRWLRRLWRWPLVDWTAPLEDDPPRSCNELLVLEPNGKLQIVDLVCPVHGPMLWKPMGVAIAPTRCGAPPGTSHAWPFLDDGFGHGPRCVP